LQPWKTGEPVSFGISEDLSEWTNMKILAGKTMKLRFNPEKHIRYIRFDTKPWSHGTPDKILEVTGYNDGRQLDRRSWRGSHLFSSYQMIEPERAWSATTTLDEIPQGAYLAICLEGAHGVEGAYAAIRVEGKPVGAPDRSPSYLAEDWENRVRKASSHYTYYVPLSPEMEGKEIDIIVLGMKGGLSEFTSEVWLTNYPAPYREKELILHR